MIELHKSSLIIKNRSGENITADFRFPAHISINQFSDRKLPLVVFCHGFKGFKDWGGFPYMLDKISAAGFFTVGFNFSYNGVGESGDDLLNFTRLHLFEKNTHSKELNDLDDVINFLDKNKNLYIYDFENLILIGHSRGGGTAIVYASYNNRIKKLITLAAISDFDRYSDRLKEKWRQDGFWEAENARTKQMMRINVSLLDDIELNNKKLNIENAAAKINIPWLIIHGKEDLAVDYSHAETLYSSNSKSSTSLKLIENTGHTFGISHPFTGSNQTFDFVIDEIISFLQN